MLSFKSIKRGLCLAFCLVLGLSLMPGPGQAAGLPSEPCTLTLTADPAGRGSAFRVFRVASGETDGTFVPAAPFDALPVELNGLSAAGLGDLAVTLTGYVQRDGIPATASARLTDRGTAVFEGLESGLYLVMGDPWQGETGLAVPVPVMLCLPARDPEGRTESRVTAEVKTEEEPQPGPGEEKPSLEVRKVWADGENRGLTRPGSVQIQLLMDGQIYDTAVLSPENNWSFTWTDLPQGRRWTVVEAAGAEGYTVTVSKEGPLSFVVVNTWQGTLPGEVLPEQPGGRLPQTGVLWWPVPLLAVGGMGCYLAGWVRSRKEERRG